MLLTGAAGFIGSHVAEALLARGDRVVGLDNFDPFYDRAIKRRNLDAVTGADPGGLFTPVEGDLCDPDVVGGLFSEHAFTGVIHLAARAGVRPSIAEPALYARVNTEGTTVLLEAARRAGSCDRFVMASSSSVYGNNAKVPFAESDDVSGPVSPYAATKRACELIAHTYHHLYGLPIACLRFFTVFGPRQRPDLAISSFMSAIAEGREIEMFGDGASSRDYTFVEDVVAGVLAAHDRVPDHGYRIWNLGGSDPVRLDEMIETIAEVVGRPARVRRGAARPGDVERTFADLTRSRAELGFSPRTPFAEGVRRQWEWARRHAAPAGV